VNAQASAMPTFDPASLAPLGMPVTSLALDSRRVQPGDVFVACPGRTTDGRAFIAQAIDRGAAAVLWDASDAFCWHPGWKVPNLALEGLQARLGALASHVYGHPSHALSVIAVTGTNGKTSVTRWIAQALSASGRRCAVVGTLGAGYPDDASMQSLANTTPDAVTLHAALARFVREGARAVALEASSIALDQHRLDAVKIDVAVFTNLTRDHLDYHPDFDAYGAAKELLFAWPTLGAAVINLDDAFGRGLAARVASRGVPVLGFGLHHAGAALAGHDLRLDRRGLQLEIALGARRVPVASRLLGEFNASNLLAAAGALVSAGIDAGQLGELLSAVDAPAGRMERVRVGAREGIISGDDGNGNDGSGDDADGDRGLPVVVVDYAHSPDALAKALETLRAALPEGGRLCCVFGCGGDRDPGKRPVMGEIAARLADCAWITSDNPRSEPAERIIDEVLAGARGASARSVPRRDADRARAIAQAIAEAGASDIVLVAGKGHEAWQEVAGVRHPFDDRSIASAALRARAGRGD
jgi:UDP-N-acetylmuramoyl-L-alanyl-D-glutamate--2,6-diaminopimelate ligase